MEEDCKVLIHDWKEIINSAYQDMGLEIHYPSVRAKFYKVIWNMSQETFEKPRAIQVVIDANLIKK